MMFGFLDWFIVSVLTGLTQDFLILEYAEEDEGKEIEVRWGEEEGRHTKFQRSCVELDGAWGSREKEFEMLLWGVYESHIKCLAFHPNSTFGAWPTSSLPLHDKIPKFISLKPEDDDCRCFLRKRQAMMKNEISMLLCVCSNSHSIAFQGTSKIDENSKIAWATWMEEGKRTRRSSSRGITVS